jgi:hypothetical protein
MDFMSHCIDIQNIICTIVVQLLILQRNYAKSQDYFSKNKKAQVELYSQNIFLPTCMTF